jgi:hypothetical protein
MPTPRRLTSAERDVLAQELRRTPGGRLGWLVAFLREDPKTWLPEHAVLHGYRLNILAHMYELEGYPSRVMIEIERPAERPSEWETPWEPARVRRFHHRLRTWMRTLVSEVSGGGVHVWVPVPMRGLTLSVARVTPPRHKPATFVLRYHGPQETILFYKLTEWIRATDRLVACRQCGEPCLALRKRVFCSPACLQLHHDRKKIEKRKRKTKGDPR